jgi:hypothetical protein
MKNVRITLATVAAMQIKLSSMEALIIKRDEIEDRIQHIHEALAALDGTLTEDGKAKAKAKPRGTKASTLKVIEKAIGPTINDRLAAIAGTNDGVTLDEIAKGLNITRATASFYVYAKKYGKAALKKVESDDGISRWVANI